MKSVTPFLIIFILSMTCKAQIRIPLLSPESSISQQVGLGKATITYHRPGLKGRKMLGNESIPYDKIWRLGANEVTTLELSEDMLLNGKLLKKGKYAFVAIPNEKEWILIINSDWKQWGVYDYKETKDIIRINVKTEKTLQSIEILTFSFDDITPTSANITFKWENTEFKLELSQDVDAIVMADIKSKTTKKNPDIYDFMYAAEYYLLKNHDLEQALVWASKVVDHRKSPFVLNLKAEIAQKIGKYEIAIESAKLAIEYTKKNGDVAAKTLAESIIKNCKK